MKSFLFVSVAICVGVTLGLGMARGVSYIDAAKCEAQASRIQADIMAADEAAMVFLANHAAELNRRMACTQAFRRLPILGWSVSPKWDTLKAIAINRETEDES